ncbi:outer membrane protein assembly factor BamB family protein [Krasilnikoviella flava]|uniref:PQQ-like domain-containing protein n=1 Tax=Krasilnikoviella flava TaxID=526729 RepID=A0A1T5LJP6_9MICO|nr:PQQ-binding-like beta-propeller repeat protein [Krasilnikoviella flava]SKC75658.1 PQQ-like domain-containing protein [Krasilnikoviella flava]
MTTHPTPSRRVVLQAGGVGVLAAVATAVAGSPAGAFGLSAARPAGPTVVDLGPAVEQFALMSAELVGDTVYIGTRNVEPARVVAFHLPTRTVTATTTVATGYAIQAMAGDPTGRYLYFGMLKKSDGPEANLYRWDLTTPDGPAEELGRIGDRDVRAVAVAPDGTVFAVGGGSPTPPELWQYDPATREVTSLGVPDAASTLARAVAATDATVYVGAGTTFGGGGGTSRASLVAYDRASGAFSQVVPDELTVDPSIRDLAVVGDRLVASTAASTASSKVALIDLSDPASATVTTSIGKTAKNFAADGDTLYFANETGILVRRADGTIAQLDLGTLELGEIWGVDLRDGRLHVTSAFGFVAEIDLATREWTTTDLAEAGAPVSAQTCMGIAAGAGYVYVGGNGVIARHSVATGEVVNFRVPGEAKDADVVDGVLYTGQYNSQGIWSYDPRGGDGPAQVAAFSSEQNRPLDTAWDDVNRLLLVGVQSDTEGGGSLWTYRPGTGGSSIATDPIDDIQLVRAVATADGVAYLGGDNAQKTGPRGTVVAWDPVAGTELWRIETGQPKGIAALAVQGRHLYALTIGGTLVVVDRVRRRVVHTASHKALVPGFAAMVTNRGVVYAVSDTTLFRFDPRSFAAAVVIAETAGGWYSGSHLNVDEDGRIYTLRGRNLVRVDDHPSR